MTDDVARRVERLRQEEIERREERQEQDEARKARERRSFGKAEELCRKFYRWARTSSLPMDWQMEDESAPAQGLFRNKPGVSKGWRLLRVEEVHDGDKGVSEDFDLIVLEDGRFGWRYGSCASGRAGTTFETRLRPVTDFYKWQLESLDDRIAEIIYDSRSKVPWPDD